MYSMYHTVDGLNAQNFDQNFQWLMFALKMSGLKYISN